MRTLLIVALVTLAPAAFASAPAGVWSKPTGVTISDADSDTPSVVITGLFTVHTGDGSEGGQWGFVGFEPAIEGYMHFVCASGDKDMCLLQWDEISKAADDKSCVGWGDNESKNGTVFATGTPLGYPDPWNLAMGIVSGYMPCQYLDAYVPPSGGDVGSDTGADVADPAPDVPPTEVTPSDTGSSDDAVDAVDDVPLSVDTVTSDTGPSDTTPTDTAASDTGTPAKDVADEGCAGGLGPLGLAGLVGLLALVLGARRSRPQYRLRLPSRRA